MTKVFQAPFLMSKSTSSPSVVMLRTSFASKWTPISSSIDTESPVPEVAAPFIVTPEKNVDSSPAKAIKLGLANILLSLSLELIIFNEYSIAGIVNAFTTVLV